MGGYQVIFFSYFFMKTYVVGTVLLTEEPCQLASKDICFCGEIRKNTDTFGL